MRALWNHQDGRAAFWKVSPDGSALEINAIFGPLPEPTATPTPTPTPTPSVSLSAPTNLVATGQYKKIELSWNGIENAASYRIYRSTTNTDPFSLVGTVDAPATTYPDADASLVIGTTYYYRVTAVNGSGQESPPSNIASAKPKPPFEIINVTNGDVLVGDVQIDVEVHDPSIGVGQIELKVDGTTVTAADPWGDVSDVRDLFFRLETKEFGNGNHTLTIGDSNYTESRQVVFNNTISNLNYNSIFDTTEGVEDVPNTTRLRATVAPPETTPYWTLKIVDEAGSEVKRFSGSVTQNDTNIDVTWDGKDVAGNEVPEGTSTGFVTFGSTPNLSSSQSLLPSENSNPQVQTPIISKSIVLDQAHPSVAFTKRLDVATPWTIKILNNANQVVKTFSGFGTEVNIVWNGITESGAPASYGNYRIEGDINSSKKGQSLPVKSASGSSNLIQRMGIIGDYDFLIQKNKITSYLILICIDTVKGGWARASGYAKFIRAKCTGVTGLLTPIQTILVKETRMNKDLSLRNRIRSQFKAYNALIYVMSHGAGRQPGFRIGTHYWYSTMPTSDPEYQNIYPNGTGEFNDVRKLAASVDYDTVSPQLVWMDNCYSAGPYPEGATNASTEWMETFRMEYSGYGAFVGNFRLCGPYGATHCRWDEWRERFWDFLMVGGNNVQTAYNRNMSITPNDCGAPLGPHDVVQWFGWGQSAF